MFVTACVVLVTLHTQIFPLESFHLSSKITSPYLVVCCMLSFFSLILSNFLPWHLALFSFLSFMPPYSRSALLSMLHSSFRF